MSFNFAANSGDCAWPVSVLGCEAQMPIDETNIAQIHPAPVFPQKMR